MPARICFTRAAMSFLAAKKIAIFNLSFYLAGNSGKLYVTCGKAFGALIAFLR